MIYSRLLLFLLLTPLFVAAQFPPTQPETGPAGKLYFHSNVKVQGPFQSAGHVGDPWYNYFIYQPADPVPADAPVVLLSPGYGGWLSEQYLGWIHHMVKMGYTVVWARGDYSLFAVWKFVPDLQDTWKDALARLSDPANAGVLVPPARDENNRPITAYAGHSLGGWLVTALAARAGKQDLGFPPPKAIFTALPGQGAMLPEDFSTIPAGTKIVMTLADGDEFCGLTASTVERIWAGTPQIPAANRNALIVRGEWRGMFALPAFHGYPTGLFPLTGGVDNLDYHGLWKLSVGLFNCAIYGEDCQYALGGGDDQVKTGTWSDGSPAKPLIYVPTRSAIRPSLTCTF